jgi:hypothetical protein
MIALRYSLNGRSQLRLTVLLATNLTLVRLVATLAPDAAGSAVKDSIAAFQLFLEHVMGH